MEDILIADFEDDLFTDVNSIATSLCSDSFVVDKKRNSATTPEADTFVTERQQQEDKNNAVEEDAAITMECDERIPLSKDGRTASWCEESSDNDEDDDIIITIDRESFAKRMEANRLKQVLDYSYYPTLPVPCDRRNLPYYHYKTRDAAPVYRLRPDDVELNNEVDRLIATSVNLRTSKVITVLVRNTLILVPTTVPISSRLADCIWPAEKTHAAYRFNNIDLFNSLLPETDRRETMAFFAARYKKVCVGLKQQYRAPQTKQHRLEPPVAQNAASGQYLFDDFTLVIVEGGKVVDAAIHGVRGNINDLVAEYKPRRVYCNTMSDDALDVFLHYPYQPFYRSLHKLMVPVFVDTSKVAMNTAPFCDRYDPFCSFCKTLLAVRGFFEYVPKTPRFLQRILAPTRRRDIKRCYKSSSGDRVVRKHYSVRGGSSYSVVVENARNRIPMRSSRRPVFSRSFRKEYARKVASTMSLCPKKRVLKSRVVVL